MRCTPVIPDMPWQQVVLADDHPSVTLALTQILSSALRCSAEVFDVTASGDQLLEVCAAAPAIRRLLVIDLVMPGRLKRLQLIRTLREVVAGADIVTYTAEESPFLAEAVCAAGAQAYVAKTSPANTLVEAILTVGRGASFIDPNIDLGRIKFHPWTTLTPAEREILLAFGRGARAKELAIDLGRSYNTVTTHKYNALEKLGLRDGNDLIPYLYEHGLIHELDREVVTEASERRDGWLSTSPKPV